MILKRLVLILCMTSVIIACNNSDDVVISPIEKTSISFDGVQTRTPLHTLSETFGLYGTVTNSNGTSALFNNQRVNYNSENSWAYSPLKYWDPQSDHKFAAYAPFNVFRNLSFSSEGYPQITDFVVQQNVGNQESLLLSRSVERYVEANVLDMSAVMFTLDPALIRINFKIKKEAGVQGGLSLNALRIYNLKSSGNCVHNGSQIIWNTSSAPTNTFGYSTGFSSAQEITIEGITAWNNGILMIPQQISNISVYVSYTHRPGDVNYSYDKDNITLPGADWEPGKQFTYILTLKPENYIEIGEPIVEPWIESSTGGGSIIIN